MTFEGYSGFRLTHVSPNPTPSILREQRVTQNMTQAQVAEKAKITLQQYQKFESGSRNLRTASFQLACRVLRALNMDIERFFDGEYVFGEEVTEINGKLCYAKTGRDINDDVEGD